MSGLFIKACILRLNQSVYTPFGPTRKLIGNVCVGSRNMTKQVQSQIKNQLGLAWLIWGLAATFYFIDYTARVAPSVMHRFLQLDFGLNEVQFGVLTASFYIPYIIMQIPVGLMVDRLSIRNLLTFMSLLTALGCCIFGLAGELFVASLGRMFIGLSAAFAMISALRLATAWFPPSMLGLLAGLTQALGMLGASAGQAPLSFLVEHTGWRQSMFVVAGLFIVLAALIYRYVRDNPDAYRCNITQNVEQVSGIFLSIRTILSSPQTWMNALYAGFLYAPTAVIGESFGAAYLQYGQGLPAHVAAFTIGLIFIGWGIGGPLSGWLSDRLGRRKPLMIFSALCGLILSSWIVFAPNMDKTTAYILFFLFGFTNAGVAIAYAVSTEIHRRSVIGISIAFTNMASIFVGALLQPMIGRLLDYIAGARSYHVEQLLLSDFQYGLRLLPICSLIALVLAFTVKETFGNPLKNEA